MNKQLPAINLAAYLILVTVNFLAIQLPFFGRTVGDVSDRYPNHFTPADFAFSIWSFIYVLLGIYIFQQSQALFRKGMHPPAGVAVVGYLFLISCILNMAWLVLWQSLHLLAAFVLIFFLWATLVLLYYRLATFPKAQWQFTLPFAFYLAWVAVAGLGNLNIVLQANGFGFFGLSPEGWTVWLVGLGVFGGLLVLYLNQDLWFALVLAWGLFGVFIKNGNPPLESSLVQNAAAIGIGVLAMGAGVTGWWKRKRSVEG